jgi:hypothetical protein
VKKAGVVTPWVLGSLTENHQQLWMLNRINWIIDLVIDLGSTLNKFVYNWLLH